MDIETLMQHMFLGSDASTTNEDILRLRIDMALTCVPPMHKEEKSNKVSKKHKRDGDKYLEKCKFEEAIHAYTSALRVAVPKSGIVGSCYHSRAIALQRMKAYEEAALDLERALQEELSDEEGAKIRQMQAKLTDLMTKGQDKGKPVAQTRIKPADKDVTVSYEENREVPGATSAIEIGHSKRYGRFFAATQPIEAGDVLLVQEPYFVYLNKTKELCFCHYCLKRTLALIPCESCTDMLYCSPECRMAAYEKYHRVECKLSGCDSDFMPFLRLFLIVTNQGDKLREILTYVRDQKKLSDVRAAGFTNNQFNGNTAQALLSLLNHTDKKVFFGYTLSTSIITVTLKNNTSILDGYNLYEVGNLIFQLTCTFKMNVVMIRDTHLNDICADALYPTFNLLNHSCVTNTVWYTSKNKNRVLLASRDIKPGEQIFNNYLGQNILLEDTQQRRDVLSEVKHFMCHCEACSRNYTFKREFKRLKVPVRVQRQLRKNPIDMESMWEVLRCMYQETKSPSAEVELMKFALMEAYMSRSNPVLMKLYKSLGIL